MCVGGSRALQSVGPMLLVHRMRLSQMSKPASAYPGQVLPPFVVSDRLVLRIRQSNTARATDRVATSNPGVHFVRARAMQTTYLLPSGAGPSSYHEETTSI